MTFYDFLTRHLKKRKKSRFFKYEKNVKYVFSNTAPQVVNGNGKCRFI